MNLPCASTEQLREMVRFERLVTDLSASFIDVPASEFDRTITQALRRIVEGLGVDRSTLTQYFPDSGELVFTHCWVVDGLPPTPKAVANGALPWTVARMWRGESLVFERLEDLPPEAALDKIGFQAIELKSHVSIPLFIDGDLVGVLSFGTLRAERTWPAELLERTRVVGEIFANVLARKRAQAEIEQLLGFERLLSEISASFVNLPPDGVDPAIGQALQRIGEFLGIERAALWDTTTDPNSCWITHVWSVADTGPPPAVLYRTQLPWTFARLHAHQAVRFATLDELPPVALADRRTFATLATTSLLSVPLVVGGTMVGALSLGAVNTPQRWPDTLIPRVRLIGEVFANALLRQQADRLVRTAQAETAHYQERLAHLIRVHILGEMSAAIAHEVNQPLMAIKNYALAALRRLRGGAAPPEKQQELLEKIIAQATRAGDVIQRLRFLVRKHSVEAQRLDLNHLVADTLKLVETDCQLRDIGLETRLSKDLPPVVVDPIQIQQVVLNLVRNAIEAMQAHPGTSEPLVVIETARTGPDELTVRVSDRGPGIAPDAAEQVFESFYSTKSSGLGIGLSICRKMIESHHGRLWTSPNPAGGAVFHFTLPVMTGGD